MQRCSCSANGISGHYFESNREIIEGSVGFRCGHGDLIGICSLEVLCQKQWEYFMDRQMKDRNGYRKLYAYVALSFLAVFREGEDHSLYIRG